MKISVKIGLLLILLLTGCSEEKENFDFKINKGNENQKYISALFEAVGYADFIETVNNNASNKEISELFHYCPYTQPSSIDNMPFFSLYNPSKQMCQTFSTIPNDASIPDYSKMYDMLTTITKTIKTIKTVGSLNEEPKKWCQDNNLEEDACLIGIEYKMLMELNKKVRTN